MRHICEQAEADQKITAAREEWEEQRKALEEANEKMKQDMDAMANARVEEARKQGQMDKEQVRFNSILIQF